MCDRICGIHFVICIVLMFKWLFRHSYYNRSFLYVHRSMTTFIHPSIHCIKITDRYTRYTHTQARLSLGNGSDSHSMGAKCPHLKHKTCIFQNRKKLANLSHGFYVLDSFYLVASEHRFDHKMVSSPLTADTEWYTKYMEAKRNISRMHVVRRCTNGLRIIIYWRFVRSDSRKFHLHTLVWANECQMRSKFVLRLCDDGGAMGARRAIETAETKSQWN